MEELNELQVLVDKFGYRINLQLWGEGENNYFIMSGFEMVDIHSAGGFDKPSEAIRDAIEWILDKNIKIKNSGI